MYYDKRIRYLNYYESGIKLQNAGYVKFQVRDHICQMAIQMRGPRHMGSGEAKVYLLTESEEERDVRSLYPEDEKNHFEKRFLGSIAVRNGQGYCAVRLNADDMGNAGVRYDEVCGIRIELREYQYLESEWAVVNRMPWETERKRRAVNLTVPPISERTYVKVAEDEEELQEKTSAEEEEVSENTENIMEIEDIKGIENTKDIGNIKDIDSTRDIENTRNINKTNDIDSTRDIYNTRDIDNAKNIKNIENIKDIENTKEKSLDDAEETVEKQSDNTNKENREEEIIIETEQTLEEEILQGIEETEEIGISENLEATEAMEDIHPAEQRLRIDKWEQLRETYPIIHPIREEEEYLKIDPKDFVIFAGKYQELVHNSFLLHGYYNYKHLILGKKEKDGEIVYYLGVPGTFHEREKRVAVMFGFEAFDGKREPAENGDFGYYLKRVEL